MNIRFHGARRIAEPLREASRSLAKSAANVVHDLFERVPAQKTIGTARVAAPKLQSSRISLEWMIDQLWANPER